MAGRSRGTSRLWWHVHSIYARVLEYVRPEDMRDDVSGVLVRSDKLVCHEPREGGRRKV